MIIYVAGKYNAPTDGQRLKNTNNAIDVAIELYTKSNHKIYPIVPHLTHWIEKRMDYLDMPPRSNEFWYEFDNMIIPKCDGLLKISKDGESKGADAEEQLAKSLGLLIFRSIDEVLEALKLETN